MPIDPSIPLAASAGGTTIPNMTEIMTKLGPVVGAMNQNQLFQRNILEQYALGQAYKGAIDENGNLDTNALMINVAKDPLIASKVGEVAKAALDRQKTQSDISQVDIENARKRFELIGQAMGSLAELGDRVTQDDVWKVANNLVVSMGDRKAAIQIYQQLKTMPQGGPELADWVKRHTFAAMSAKDQFDLTHPPVQNVDLGGGIKPVQQPRVFGDGAGGGGGSVASPDAPPPPAGGGGTGGVPYTTSTGPAPGYTPNTSSPTTEEVARANAPPTGGQQTGGVMKKIPTYEQENVQQLTYQQKSGEKMADYENALNERVRAASELIPRMEMEERQLREFQTGAVADLRLNAARLLKASSLPYFETKAGKEFLNNVANGEIDAAQTFHAMIVTQAMEQLKQTLGGQGRITNLEVDAFLRSYPNLLTDPDAINKIYNFTRKQAQQVAAEQAGFNEFKLSIQNKTAPKGTTLDMWEDKWRKNLEAQRKLSYDPRENDFKGGNPEKNPDRPAPVRTPGGFVPGKTGVEAPPSKPAPAQGGLTPLTQIPADMPASLYQSIPPGGEKTFRDGNRTLTIQNKNGKFVVKP